MHASATLIRSVTGLVKAMVGAGILGLPFAFGQTGLLLGMALLVFSAGMQMFTCHLLLSCIKSQREQSTGASSTAAITYATLADQCFGCNPSMRAAVDASIALGCFGFATSYLIVLGGLCPQVALTYGVLTGPLLQRQFWITTLGWGTL